MLTQIRFPAPVTVAIGVLTSAILRHYPPVDNIGQFIEVNA
ncbi:hypothetical protein [Citrobacter sp. U14242]